MFNWDIAALKSANSNIFDLLPEFEVYTTPGDSYAHFLPGCKGGVRETQHFFYLDADSACLKCRGEPGWDIYASFLNPVSYLEELQCAYVSLAATAASIEAGFSPDIDIILDSFSEVHKIAPEWLVGISKNEVLLPLAKELDSKIEAANNVVVSYFQSTSGRKQLDSLPLGALSDFEWNDKDNALMFTMEGLEHLGLALGISYGVEVAPGKFVAQASSPSLTYIREGATMSCPFHLAEGTPLEVLTTAVLLWEPQAITALGDARKALDAAWELTPTV